MTSPLEITRLGPGDDLDEASALFDAYRQFYGYPSSPDAVKSWLASRLSRRESVVMLARQGDQAVGFMQLYPTFCSLALAPIWTLHDLFVVPEARGHGVADRLLASAAALARETGAAFLQLSTAHDNHVSQRVYERNGWKLDTVFRTYILEC